MRPVENYLRRNFIPELLRGVVEHITGQEFTLITIKYEGLVMPYPNLSTPENYTAPCVITSHLVVALQGWIDFWSGDNALMLRNDQAEIWRQKSLNTM